MTTCLETSTNSVADLRGAYASLCAAELEEALTAELDPSTLTEAGSDFASLSHRHQDPPPHANNGGPWTTWLVLGGRGAGKTRLGAEWVRALVHGYAPYAEHAYRRIALVGESERDVREVMIEGPSGLLATASGAERPVFMPSRRRVEWPNGAVAEAFSAEDPDSLRGPQFDAAWCDELAKWRNAQAAFDMLQFGLRLGQRPRALITTTPRPIPLLKRLIADPRTAVTRAATRVNAAFLAPSFLDEVVARYAGTRLGRQELDGEIIEDRADALWSRGIIEACRVRVAPPLMRIVVAIDPPAGSRSTCGIVAAGRSEDGQIYVLEDASAAGLSPAGWANKAIALYRRRQANLLVAEVNQGGEMVRAVMREVDPSAPLRTVHATRGKFLRAEPVAAMYAQGRVKHVDPPLAELEDQMCNFGLDGLAGGGSPDRLDALVWAVTELAEPAHWGPRILAL